MITIWLNFNYDEPKTFSTPEELYEWLRWDENLEGTSIFQTQGLCDIVPCVFMTCAMSSNATITEMLWRISLGVANPNCETMYDNYVVSGTSDNLVTETAAKIITDRAVNAAKARVDVSRKG